MKTDEANRIIAEYMDRRCYNCGDIDTGHCCFAVNGYGNDEYTNSLDALVPVWEKLKDSGVFMNQFFPQENRVQLYKEKCAEEYSPFDRFDYFMAEENTIQEAAAIATAKAIQELK